MTTYPDVTVVCGHFEASAVDEVYRKNEQGQWVLSEAGEGETLTLAWRGERSL